MKDIKIIEDDLREYFHVKIKFIKRRTNGGYQKRYQASFKENDIVITTEKKLKTCIKVAMHRRILAINEAIEKGQLILI